MVLKTHQLRHIDRLTTDTSLFVTLAWPGLQMLQLELSGLQSVRVEQFKSHHSLVYNCQYHTTGSIATFGIFQCASIINS